MLEGLGAETTEVREPEQLLDLDGLVIPGGESTTIAMGMQRDGLDRAVTDFHASGKPILGSCAGMIVCDRDHLGIGDYACRRNAFGRQLASFEADLPVEGIGEEPLRAVFIRSPWVEDAGDDVEVLAEIDGHPVATREPGLLTCAFHPELTDDSRFHALFTAMVTTSTEAAKERA